MAERRSLGNQRASRIVETSMAINRSHHRRIARVAVLSFAIVGAAACGSDASTPIGSGLDNSIPSPLTDPAVTAPIETQPVDTDPPSTGTRVDVAIADAAQRRGVDPSDVAVLTTEDVTWRDGAVGCPEQDLEYSQALVPGGRIVVDAVGQVDVYHYGDQGPPFYCANPEEPLEAAGSTSADD